MYFKLFIILSANFCFFLSPAQTVWGEQSIPLPSAKHAQKDNQTILQILPNPGNGLYQVFYRSTDKGQLNLAVSDATGKYVYLKSIRDFDGELKESIDLSLQPKGIYIFQVEGDNHRELKKVIYQ